ncbi:hypothetical protein HUW46_08444 [Amycolatopsis sp. CA-230715]|nr:hypothetical protein HUW46_08444 [Amycolatopsis sp. CA-230715]
MHGHQIRRAAQLDHVDRWTNIKPGSLYGALQRMDTEGLVRKVRTEQEGGRPQRTVYEITEEGRHELVVQRAAALREARLSPDPIDLALGHVAGMTEDAVRSAIEDRRASLGHQHQEMCHLREEAAAYLSAMEKMIFEHTLRRLRLEIDWHDDLLGQLPALLVDPSRDTVE